MRIKKPLNIIVYGIGGTLKQSIEYIKLRFNIVGCSDRNPDKAADEMVRGICYYEPQTLCDQQFDYIFIASDFDTAIKKFLVEEIGIDEKKVLKREEWYTIPVEAEFGELNPDKTFYVMSKPIRIKNGIMSNVLCFIEQLSKIEGKGYIPVVDMRSFPSQYLEDSLIGTVNAWEYYYEPLSEYSLDEVYSSKNVILGYDSNCYTENYEQQYDIGKLSYIYKKYIRLKPEFRQQIEAEYGRIIGSRLMECRGNNAVLGVLFRGTDMVSLKLEHHSVQPSVEEMIALIKEHMDKWNCRFIYLCTEDARAMECFKSEFGDRLLCTDQRRFGDTGSKWLAQINNDRDNDKYLRGTEYITTIELLLRCDYLLAGICSGSVCALIMKDGKYKAVNMVNKGVYKGEGNDRSRVL